MGLVLKNDNLEVGFKALSAALSSIRTQDGLEYLWQGDQRYWGNQAPVCFPICGSIRGNQAVTRSGRRLNMPRHGIAKSREFSVARQTPEQIVFVLESDAQTLEQYPYAFRFEVAYTLTGRTIRVEYRISNQDSEAMPFFAGGHPAFRCPLYDNEDYRDYRLEFEQEETLTLAAPIVENGLLAINTRTPLLSGTRVLPLDHQLFAVDGLFFDTLKSRSVRLTSKNHGRGLKLDYRDFPYFVVWSSRNGGPFIALEPWLGLSTCDDESDVFEEKRNVQTAQPGETRQYHFEITIS